MTIDEILNIDQFNYLISYFETTFFTNKIKEADNLKSDFEHQFAKYIYGGDNKSPNISCFNPNDLDAYMTSIQGKMVTNIILLNKDKINLNLLILYFGSMSHKYLKWILDAEAGKHQGRDEFCYNDGEIVVIDNNNIRTNKSENSIEDIKIRLAEGVLIAESQITNVKKLISRTGTYFR